MTNLPNKPIALGAAASTQIPNRTMKTFIRLFHAVYLRQYFQLRPSEEAEFRRRPPMVVAARLSENIPKLERWLVKRAGKVL